MKNAPYLLDTSDRRRTVETAIARKCAQHDWDLLALNVRTNHVHVVVVGSGTKERVLADLKAQAARALREAGLADQYADVWSHHGSTRS
ncbi:transposase [Candidatus Amarobacter glycogenicus]|uniref:transposase n=1 Tax=Candidatus Amarobacter glycogenicus TaxID=3140699 RepID=UPI002A164155|nr:transposase [Dehalococcoidia bacterium]